MRTPAVAPIYEGRPLTSEELDWAHECAAAGDTFAEIGQELALTAVQVQGTLQVSRPMSPREAEIASLWAAGALQREIAAEVGGLTRGGVHMVLVELRRKGFRIRSGPMGRPTGDDDTASAIRQALRDDVPLAEICTTLDVSRSVVATLRDHLGIAAAARSPRGCEVRGHEALPLVAAGLSYSEAASRVGSTKNAVAGAVYRARKGGEARP